MTTTLNIARLDSSRTDALEIILRLRREAILYGNGIGTTEEARNDDTDDDPLMIKHVVARICDDVKRRGLDAVLEYTAQRDHVMLDPESVRVSADDLASAYGVADPAYLRTIRRVRDNIMTFQAGILHRDATMRRASGFELTLRYRPLRRIGICIPGTRAAHLSGLLMTVVPAQAAGVEQIAVVVPPTEFGGYHLDLLAACHALGVTEVYRISGPQAVAALAYGVEGIAPVDKIVGPGNLFVNLAKQHVFGTVDIDGIGTPRDEVLLADWTADPQHLAVDLIGQAEPDPTVTILMTWEADLIDRVADALAQRLAHRDGHLTRQHLERFGVLILVRDADEALDLVNQIAPERLQISTSDPQQLAERVENAGTIFLGHDTPTAVGDYAAGPSNVLPAGGTARWASGLCANDFLKRSSLIHVDHRSLTRLANDIRVLADKEGRTAHRDSVDIRLEDRPDGE